MAYRPSSPPPPLSRMLDVAHIGADGLATTLRADPRECAALAELLGLPGLADLVADLKLTREGRTGIRVTGAVRARVTQNCVVTLDTFETDVVEPVDVHFLPQAEVESRAAELAARPPDAEMPAEDLPDAIVNGRIDLGALTGEFLALGLDPYPKKPGASFVAPETAAEEADVSPFAALARLKPESPH